MAQRYTSEPDFMKHQQIQKRIRKFVQASNRVDYKYERSLRAVAKQKCNSQGIKSLPISMSLEEIDHRR